MAQRANSDHQDGESQPLLQKSGPETYEQQHHRNQSFDGQREPFRDNEHLRLDWDTVDGAFWFMNPTQATFSYFGRAGGVYDDQDSNEYQTNEEDDQTFSRRHTGESDIQYKWTSRNNRKGRHCLVVNENSDGSSSYETPATGFKAVLQGIWRMLTTFHFWDISYVTAVVFTLAVVILLGNAVLSAVPYIFPSWQPPESITYIEGALTLTGCWFFLVSSFLSWLEALNADQQGCFGWRLEETSSQDPTVAGTELGHRTRLVPDWNCIHRRNNYSNLFNDSNGKQENTTAYNGQNGNSRSHDTSSKSDSRSQWRWLPSWKDLRDHFIRDLGFVTCTILLFSSIVYCAAAAASFVSVLQTGAIANWIRYPQLVAGIGFIIASLLFMLETQTHWLIPEWRALGWHISFWNFIGSIGFTLCAAFALASILPEASWAEYQLAYSYCWGSLGFFLGALIQWFESLDKHPVESRQDDS